MNGILVLAFLFFIGAVLGWVLELIFRKFFSRNNPEHKWINPGFCVGPWVPIYGLGLCFLYLLARVEDYNIIKDPILNKIILFLLMAVVMTLLEYIAGLILLKVFNTRLWDYSHKRGNIQGIICPMFSLGWALLGALYYFLVDPHILNALAWLSENLSFSFFIGLFYGVFIVDLFYSAQIIAKVRRFAAEKGIVVAYERLKSQVAAFRMETIGKRSFLLPFHSELPLSEHLKMYHESQKETIEKLLERIHRGK